jgi:hypothetical protein
MDNDKSGLLLFESLSIIETQHIIQRINGTALRNDSSKGRGIRT